MQNAFPISISHLPKLLLTALLLLLAFSSRRRSNADQAFQDALLALRAGDLPAVALQLDRLAAEPGYSAEVDCYPSPV